MQPESASGGYGNFTCIQHGGSLSTCYAHQSRFGTSVGASVSQGQVIGYVGCTGRCFGDHLHFETRINGAVVNPTELPVARVSAAVQPEIHIFGLTIQTFGLCLGLSFLVAGWIVAQAPAASSAARWTSPTRRSSPR